MSWRASAWALKQRCGQPGPKLTLLALASYATEADGVAWPSQQTLADATEQSVDSIQRHLRLLEQLGLISIERRQRRGGAGSRNVYRLPFNRPHHAANPSRTMRPIPKHHRPQMTPSIGRNAPPNRPQALRHDPSIDPSSDPSEPQGVKNGEGEPSQDSVPNPVRKRQEEEQRLANERKGRETLDEIKKRLGPNYGPRRM